MVDKREGIIKLRKVERKSKSRERKSWVNRLEGEANRSTSSLDYVVERDYLMRQQQKYSDFTHK